MFFTNFFERIVLQNYFFPFFFTQICVLKNIKFTGVYFKCSGNAGHGSLLLKNTAGEKVNYLISKFMEFRANEVQRLENNPELTIGDVTTVNLTMLEGGVQSNVVPPLLTVVFDVRLAIDVDLKAFESNVRFISTIHLLIHHYYLIPQ